MPGTGKAILSGNFGHFLRANAAEVKPPARRKRPLPAAAAAGKPFGFAAKAVSA